MNDRKYRFIDLFAGAGGLSEGFVMNGDFLPLAHVEMNKDACDTLKTRSCYYYLKENNMLDIYRDYQQGLIRKEVLYSYVPSGLVQTIINSEISENSIGEIF
ncbi:MAG: DNA cytosine methyltransferase, partial [Anaerovoracaceae bacterium]